ncbi:polysaccharide biosynthesis protein [Virgibacillus sp. Bac330]|uniref:polysaccharide biosynthesis protein n=1 Tax=Virgibacillus sp. Bac330 TaxID=2419841 RepID=UPI000EF53427|nr:polysaccharide biosynthesis protein [Virgibacillus sp. Bac330]
MFKNKVILVIGATGTVGYEIVKKIIKERPKCILLFGRNEYHHFKIQQSITYDGLKNVIGDIRDKESLRSVMREVDYVFNFAALKHVEYCENNPFEAIKTNLIGLQNIIECAFELNVKKVIHASSDKAVNPINVMGATKMLGERLILSKALATSSPIFATVRFTNIIESRGSVVEVWLNQIKKKSPVTITCPNMTRYVMLKDKAVQLVLNACKEAKGGEIFIPKSPEIKLNDLCQIVINEASDMWGIDKNSIIIHKIGRRSGEKKHEELIGESEKKFALENDDTIIINPFKKNLGQSEPKYSYSNRNDSKEVHEIVRNIIRGMDI